VNKLAICIRRLGLSLTVLSAMLPLALYSAPAHAQLFHTWVSNSGVDGNPCTPGSPCATFARAATQTDDGGEIGCLNSGGYMPSTGLTITKTLTIDCNGTVGWTNGDPDTYSGSAITINGSGIVVHLRNLSISGIADRNVNTNGVAIQAAAAVYIENCTIKNFAQHGIIDQRTGGGTSLSVKDTYVTNNTGAGIVAAAAATNSVVLENVHSAGNTYGLAVGTGNHVAVSRSVMFGNSTAGVEADPGGQLYVDYTEIANNGTGVQAYGNVALGNSGIVSNTTGISGTTTSYGNNRIFANFSAGTAPTPIGGVSTDYGQQ
jgi:hypothetical protein